MSTTKCFGLNTKRFSELPSAKSNVLCGRRLANKAVMRGFRHEKKGDGSGGDDGGVGGGGGGSRKRRRRGGGGKFMSSA